MKRLCPCSQQPSSYYCEITWADARKQFITLEKGLQKIAVMTVWKARVHPINVRLRVRSAAVVRFFERHVVELEKQLRMGDQHGFFQNIKSVHLEETKKVESKCVRDEEGRLLRDKGRVRERWVRFFRSLLNSKSDMLDAGIPKRLPQHHVASALGIEPTEEEIATAMKAMANAKAVGPDGLPAELLKLGLQ